MIDQESSVTQKNSLRRILELGDDYEDDEDDEDEVDLGKVKGPNLIKSIGVFFAIAAIITLIILLILCFRACAMTQYSCFRFYMRLKNLVFYNLFIRFALQSFLKFLIAALTTITVIDWSTDGVSQGVPAIIIMVILLALPFTFVFVMKKNYVHLQWPSRKERIGSIYMGMNTEKVSALAYSIVFFIRRVLFAFLTFSLASYPHL